MDATKDTPRYFDATIAPPAHQWPTNQALYLAVDNLLVAPGLWHSVAHPLD